jgi:hypothetical protein
MVTKGRNRELIRNMKRGQSRFPKEPELSRLAQLIEKPVEWITGDDRDGDRVIVPFDEIEGFTPPITHGRAVSHDGLYRGADDGSIPEIHDRAGAGDGTLGEVVHITSAGILSGHPVAGEWTFPIDTTRHWFGVDPRQAVIMQVKGDSMEPTLRGNDRVIVDLTDQVPHEPSIYVIDEGHGPMIKRVRIIAGSVPLQLQIQSDNPLGGTWTRHVKDVRVIGRVRGRLTVF